MLEQLFEQKVEDTLTFSMTLSIMAVSLLLGFIISIVYMRTHKKEGYSNGFVTTLIMLPSIIAIIILLVGNNIARAFSLAGAFSLIRYRSNPGNPKDIAYVFFTLAVGLTCGMGYIAYAILFTIVLCLVMIILYLTKYGTTKIKQMKLRITLPEDLDYQSLFNDVFNEYLKNYEVSKVKTTNFGSLYEVTYLISLKENANKKDLIDKIRCRNKNLDVTLAVFEEEKAF